MNGTIRQEVRLFDLDEAERMLPLVRVIVKGMMDDNTERKDLLERLAATGSSSPDGRCVKEEIDQLTEKLTEAAAELEALDVEFKGIELGLIDFPSERDGEIICLCWQYGEESIRFWHPHDAGFAGRQSIETN